MSIHVAAPFEVVSDTAPFSAAQRKWLNAFFVDALLKSAPVAAPLPAAAAEDQSTPWHDPALPLEERMVLAEGRPLPQRMMAAMAQQDCGQCGYTCAKYSALIAEQGEPRLNLCVPGGKATARMLKSLVEEMGGGVLDPEEQAAKVAATRPDVDTRPGYSRARPVTARLLGRRRLNAEASEKTTMHIEIDLMDSGIDYVVGDSLGVFAPNPPELADAVIAAIDAPADFPIAGKPLRQVLIEDMSLGLAPDSLFEFICYLTGGARRKKARALSKGEDVDGDLDTLDVLAALQKFPGIRPDPEAFVEVLEPMQPRLYSISSSPKADPGRVMLTVDVVRYRVGERDRQGVASSWLGHRQDHGTSLQVYVQKAHGFALPADPDVPVIMVGPGTGVAPFRAFLRERQATGASGGAWLFYGHQRQATDFFYADEFTQMLAQGPLSRLSCAWSRDGAEKVYVQHRMREEADELFAWLEAGAHFYVCGDAKRMARDVEKALIDVVAAAGGRDPQAAMAYIAALKAAGRYQADVY